MLKRLKLFCLTFLTLGLLVQISNNTKAQTLNVTDADFGKIIAATATVDSLDTTVTKAFSFGKNVVSDWSTNPVRVGYLITSTAGTPKVRTIIQGSYDASTYFNVDTLFADSAETFTNTTANLNGGKFPYYRLALIGYTGNRSDTSVKLWLYAYKDEY